MAKTLKALKTELEHCRTINPREKLEDSGYDTRHTYCHLIFVGELKGVHYPKFEVRGWTKKRDYMDIEVVNWTVTAGTATLHLKEETVGQWEVLETNPALQVLIGNK